MSACTLPPGAARAVVLLTALLALPLSAGAVGEFFFTPDPLADSDQAKLETFEVPSNTPLMLPVVAGVAFCDTNSGTAPAWSGPDCTATGNPTFYPFNDNTPTMIGQRHLAPLTTRTSVSFSELAVEFMPPFSFSDGDPNTVDPPPITTVQAAGAWIAPLGTSPAAFLKIGFYHVERPSDATTLLDSILIDLTQVAGMPDGRMFVGFNSMGGDIGRVVWEQVDAEGNPVDPRGGFGVDNLRWGTPVPEPGTSLLVGLGLALLAGGRRRRR